jgi:hypothetical protein
MYYSGRRCCVFRKNRIVIDPVLHDRAAARARELGYASLREFVEHLLERELSSDDGAEGREKVLARMKGLGYLQ